MVSIVFLLRPSPFPFSFCVSAELPAPLRDLAAMMSTVLDTGMTCCYTRRAKFHCRLMIGSLIDP